MPCGIPLLERAKRTPLLTCWFSGQDNIRVLRGSQTGVVGVGPLAIGAGGAIRSGQALQRRDRSRVQSGGSTEGGAILCTLLQRYRSRKTKSTCHRASLCRKAIYCLRTSRKRHVTVMSVPMAIFHQNSLTSNSLRCSRVAGAERLAPPTTHKGEWGTRKAHRLRASGRASGHAFSVPCSQLHGSHWQITEGACI
jgi:hypothetical protein